MEPTSAPARDPKPKATTPDQLDQDLNKVQKGKGALGSLENPEVYEHVPGHVIPILEREFEDFDFEAGKFLDGQTPRTSSSASGSSRASTASARPTCR